MEQLSNRFKGVFVQTFKNGNTAYGNLTIAELVDVFQKHLDESERIKQEQEDAVIKKYTGLYLKKISEDSLFGTTLEVIKIDSLTTSSYTDNWDRTYLLTGNCINFDYRGLTNRPFDTSVHSMYTERQLDAYTVITEDEYQSYLATYEEISNKLNDLLNEH